jgi:branched-chain amino acid transport system substrate-binding protein
MHISGAEGIDMDKAAALINCLLLVLCSTSAVRVDAAADRQEILIGAHLPLTGALAMASAEQKWAYEQAVKDINKRGGIYLRERGKKLPVRLLIKDDETSPAKAAEVVEKLVVEDKVDLLLSGFTGANGVIPGLITAERYNRYYHASVVWPTDFLKHGFQSSTMYFFDAAQGARVFFEIWATLPARDRPERLALFVEETSDGSQMAAGLVAFGAEYGYDIVVNEAIPRAARDFHKQISKAKAARADAAILFLNTEEAVSLVRQSKASGLELKYVAGWKGTWAPEFQKALGPDAELVISDGFWSEDFPYAGAKQLGLRFRKQFKKHSVSVGMYYALCQILWQALTQAGSVDTGAIRRAVIANEFQTVMGPVNYDDRGVALFRLPAFQWVDAKLEILYPPEVARARVKPMQPGRAADSRWATRH